jgi:hypothetical protein
MDHRAPFAHIGPQPLNQNILADLLRRGLSRNSLAPVSRNADVMRNLWAQALFTCNADQNWNEAMIAVTVDGW